MLPGIDCSTHVWLRSGERPVLHKKDFTSQSFVADSSECKRQNPSFVAIRGYVADNKDRASYLDDAKVRDCMKAKGYNIQLETK